MIRLPLSPGRRGGGLVPCLTGASAALLSAALLMLPATAQDLQETPFLADRVAAGDLPPVTERVPTEPAVADLLDGQVLGTSGGRLSWLAGRARDIRIMNVYGFARLVGYDAEYNFVPDILADFTVEEGRRFTFTLREGMRWSDGAPFTTEDFRYRWEDVETDPELKRFGPDSRFLVDGEPPTVTIVDETTVVYEWSKPNPAFLPAIAGARPLYLYAPSHYLRQFHAAYADAETLATLVEEAGQADWVALHTVRDDLYDAREVAIPRLQPWINTTPPPAERFVFERNPFYHRIDANGVQLPYLDEVVVSISDGGLIPAKTGTGEADLQARHIRFDNYTFLKQQEDENDYTVRLWRTAFGADMALYPNLNAADPVWREVMRDRRFRLALSHAINREEINQVNYFGLARPSNNYVLPESPLYDAEEAVEGTAFDVERANALLDEMGLTERDGSGLRLLPDGRPMNLVVHTAGERTLETDILQLIADTWEQIGVGLFVTASQRDVFRTRVFSGEALMSVWFGFDNGLITADTVPNELAPVDQNWLQYPAWGQYVQTNGEAGTPPDLPWAQELMDLYGQWMVATDAETRRDLTDRMLAIHVDEMTSIGIVQGVYQPVVVADDLRNVPEEGLYSWDPGGHFGFYRPDVFFRASEG